MKGILKYKTKDGKYFKTKKEISVKEARQYYENKLKEDNNITDVYMIKFKNWNYEIIKVFKKEG
jgi:hypothetical protein